MGILDMFKKKDNEQAKAPEANVEVNNQTPEQTQAVPSEVQQQVSQTPVPAATPVTPQSEPVATPVIQETQTITPDNSISQTVGVNTNNMIQSNPFMEVPSTPEVQTPIQQPIQPNLENVFNVTSADLNATPAASIAQVTPIEPQAVPPVLEQVPINQNLTAEVQINSGTPAIDVNQQANFVTPTPVPATSEIVSPVDTPLAPVIDPTLNMEQPAIPNVAPSMETTPVEEVANVNPMADAVKPIEAEKNNAQDIIPVVEDTAALIDNPQPIATPGANLNVDLIDVFEGGENVTKEDEITNIVTEAVAAEEQVENQEAIQNVVPQIEIKDETPVTEVQPTQNITEEQSINIASVVSQPEVTIPDVPAENNAEITPVVSSTENVVAETTPPAEQVETSVEVENPVSVEIPEIQSEVVTQPEVAKTIAPTEVVENTVTNEEVSVPVEEPVEVTPTVEAISPVEVAPIEISSEPAIVTPVSEEPTTSVENTPIAQVTEEVVSTPITENNEEVSSNIENIVPTPLITVEQVEPTEITEVPVPENVVTEVVSEESVVPSEKISAPETPVVLAETTVVTQPITEVPVTPEVQVPIVEVEEPTITPIEIEKTVIPEVAIAENPVSEEAPQIQPELVTQSEVAPTITSVEVGENIVANESVSMPVEEPVEVTPTVEVTSPVEVAPIEISSEPAIVPPVSEEPTTSVENTPITPAIEVNNDIPLATSPSAPEVEKKVVHITELPLIPEEKAKTKFCDNCGTMITDDASICPNCSEPIN